MTTPLRSLAVVDHVGNDGGGSRFLRALVPSLKRERPELQITVFGNLESLSRDGLNSELRMAGAKVRTLKSVRPPKKRLLGIPGSTVLAERIQRRTRDGFDRMPPILTGNIRAEIKTMVQGFDVVYFAWPYGLRPPAIANPMVTTIHDLNFRYFFGSVVWSTTELATLEEQVAQWIRTARVVTSSAFMAREVTRLYPGAAAPSVIRLAGFSGLRPVSDQGSKERLQRLGIQEPYALCPTHAMTHKNLGPLIAAMALLRGEFPRLTLVLTGNQTDIATGRATFIGTERDATSPDVIGLGYVSNDDIDALIKRASVVVNSSLYEAGNGSGVDAWRFGVPVAMSDIEPFREHLEVQGVWAELFNPRDPHDIAARIASILRNENHALDRARASAIAFAPHTWQRTATEYLDVFDRVRADSAIPRGTGLGSREAEPGRR
jgi:glycosyltransferase involved in cell wall biosynthesis